MQHGFVLKSPPNSWSSTAQLSRSSTTLEAWTLQLYVTFEDALSLQSSLRDAPDERTDDGNPRVTPIRAALPRDG